LVFPKEKKKGRDFAHRGKEKQTWFPRVSPLASAHGGEKKGKADLLANTQFKGEKEREEKGGGGGEGFAEDN